MDTRAVYKIHEKGREFYFYTRYAGGVSYPFEAAKYFGDLKHALGKKIREQEVCIAPLLAQMKGTFFFPDALKDELLFTETTKEIAESMVREVPFFITVDVDQYTVSYHFNKQFEELENLSDISFPCCGSANRNSGESFINESLSRQMGEGTKTFHATNEMIFRELIEKAVVEQGQIQNQNQSMTWGYYE